MGAGSFGQVYLVQDSKTNQTFAMKFCPWLVDGDQEQLFKEVQALRKLKHPNVIEYISSIDSQDSLRILMEFAEGGDLNTKIKQQKGMPFPDEVVLEWFIQICDGLAYIHEQGIIHCDLKPRNIFLTSDNKSR